MQLPGRNASRRHIGDVLPGAIAQECQGSDFGTRRLTFLHDHLGLRPQQRRTHVKRHLTGRSSVARVGIAGAMVATTLGVTAPPSSAIDLKLPMAVVARDFRFLGVPKALPAAQYDLRFFNISRDEDHEFVAFNLGPTCSATINTVDDAKALVEAGKGAFRMWCPGGSFEGAAFAGPGGRDREEFNLTPGKTLYFCGVRDENGTPHFDLGMIGLLDVFRLPGGP